MKCYFFTFLGFFLLICEGFKLKKCIVSLLISYATIKFIVKLKKINNNPPSLANTCDATLQNVFVFGLLSRWDFTENGEICFPIPKMVPSMPCFVLNLKLFVLLLQRRKKKQEIFTFKKVKSANFYPNPTICSKRFLKLISDYQNNWQMNVIADR